MNALQIFNFEAQPVRVIEIDGSPWFVGSDVRNALGITQNGQNFRFLDEDEVRLVPSGLVTGKGMSQAKLLSESGLYKFILRSDKPVAKPFQDWVTKVVLPGIRKDGGYILGEEKVVTGELSEDELVFRAMEVMKRKLDRLQEEKAQAVALAAARAVEVTEKQAVITDQRKKLELLTLDTYRALYVKAYGGPSWNGRMAIAAARLLAKAPAVAA